MQGYYLSVCVAHKERNLTLLEDANGSTTTAVPYQSSFQNTIAGLLHGVTLQNED